MYRVAIQINTDSSWQWKSTVLGSMETLFGWLRLYRMIPLEQLRVFSASSKEDLHEQLLRANQGLDSTSVPAATFLKARRMSIEGLTGVAPAWKLQVHQRHGALPVISAAIRNQRPIEGLPVYEQNMPGLERQRVAIEGGPGGDHDRPYRFAFPTSMPQVITWLRLMKLIQRGALQP